MNVLLRSARYHIKLLLKALNDIAQRALTVFRRECAGIATGHLPGGAHAVVVIGNDRHVPAGLSSASPRGTNYLVGFAPDCEAGPDRITAAAAPRYRHHLVLRDPTS